MLLVIIFFLSFVLSSLLLMTTNQYFVIIDAIIILFLFLKYKIDNKTTKKFHFCFILQLAQNPQQQKIVVFSVIGEMN